MAFCGGLGLGGFGGLGALGAFGGLGCAPACAPCVQQVPVPVRVKDYSFSF